MSQPFVAGSLAALALSNLAYSFWGSPGAVQSGPGEETTVRIEEVLEPDTLCQCPPVQCLPPVLLDVQALDERLESYRPQRVQRVVDFLPAGLAGAALTSFTSWLLEKCRRVRGDGAEEEIGFDTTSGTGAEAEGWDVRIRGLRGGRGTLA